MLSLVERGLRNPSLDLVLRIADGIGADLSGLIRKARQAVPRAGQQPATARARQVRKTKQVER